MINNRILSKADFKDFCSFCGFALLPHEISADIQGNLVLFEERTTGSCQITLCQECKDRILLTAAAGMDAAILKRLDIDNSMQTKVTRTRKNRRRKDDDEDKSGGVSSVLPP